MTTVLVDKRTRNLLVSSLSFPSVLDLHEFVCLHTYSDVIVS